MSKNANLQQARTAKNDEFYTRREDIEAELQHYQDEFRGKVVYCNCDDPNTSEFWQYFVRNFQPLGLKKLLATHYDPDEQNYSYKLEITGDENGDGRVTDADRVETKIHSNGDFRSQACIDLLKEADIVVTNPPFSLWHEYVAQLIEYDKKFLIIGNRNAITYKDIFPLIRNNKMWLGWGFPHGDAYFQVKDSKTFADNIFNPETGLVHFRNCAWFTNMVSATYKGHVDTEGNHYYNSDGTPNSEKYPKYDNYDAININKVNDIPDDYNGVMGVPITFLDQYNPQQFELVGFRKGDDGKDLVYTIEHEMRERERVQPYFRILIRRNTSVWHCHMWND